MAKKDTQLASNSVTRRSNKNTYTIESLNKTHQIVHRDGQKNVKKVVFPNNVQIGAGSQLPSTLNVGGEIKGYIHTLSDGTTPYILAQSGITITSSSNGQLVISSTGGGGSGAVSSVANGADDRVATFSSANALNGEANLTFDGSTLNVKGAVNINPDSADNDFIVKDDNSKLAIHVNANQSSIQFFDINSNDIIENDINFYVSGTAGSRGTSTRGTALFAGDVMLSGSLHVTENILPSSTPSDGQVIAWDNTNKRLYWKTAVAAFAFASAISNFVEAEVAMTTFAALAFDPRTQGTTAVSGTIATI
jgi:hypothetical protein